MIELKQALPKVFYILANEISKYTIKFPSGKEIVLLKGTTYSTSDAEEIEFLRIQKGLGVSDPCSTKDNFMRYIGSIYSEQPTLEQMFGKTEDELSKYLLSTMSENLVIDHLIKSGYQEKLTEFLKKLEAEQAEQKKAEEEPKEEEAKNDETCISSDSEEQSGESEKTDSQKKVSTNSKNHRPK